MRTVLGMRLTARWKTRARRPSPRSMRTRPGPPRATQRAPARPRGGEGEIISLTSLKLKAAHKRHLRRGQAGPSRGEAGAEGDYNGGRRQGGGTFRGRMYLDDTGQPPRGTRRFPGERGSEPQDAPRLARSAENTRDRHPAALAAEGLGTAVAWGGRQGAPRGVDAAVGTWGTFAGREARGAAALQGGGVGGFRKGAPHPGPALGRLACRGEGETLTTARCTHVPQARRASLGNQTSSQVCAQETGAHGSVPSGVPRARGFGEQVPLRHVHDPGSEGAERVVTWERGGAGPRSPQRPHMVPDPAGRRPGRRGGLGPARSGRAGLGHGSRRGGADVSALHDSTTARGRFARVLGPGRPGDGAWAAEVAPPEARPRGRLRPWLSALSFQKPPREEEEEAVPVAHRSQGRIPARVPEQAGGAPALGPLGQHLSRGEPGLQPGALQVSGLARALRPTPSRPVPLGAEGGHRGGVGRVLPGSRRCPAIPPCASSRPPNCTSHASHPCGAPLSSQGVWGGRGHWGPLRQDPDLPPRQHSARPGRRPELSLSD